MKEVVCIIIISYILTSLALSITILLPNIHKETSIKDIKISGLCFLWPGFLIYYIIKGLLFLIKKAFHKKHKKEFPSYGKALAAITQKWDNNNPAPPQIQAASLMYDYLLEWYSSERI